MFAYCGLNTLPRDFVAESAHRSAVPWALSPTARPVVAQLRPAFCVKTAWFCLDISRKLAKKAFSPSFAWATRATNGRGKRTLVGTNGGKGGAASGHKAKKRKGESPPQGAVRGLSRRFNIFPCRGSLSSFFRTSSAALRLTAAPAGLLPSPGGPPARKIGLFLGSALAFRHLCCAKMGCGSDETRKSELSLASPLAFLHLCFAKIGCGSAKPRKIGLFLGSALAFAYLWLRQAGKGPS